MYVEPDLFDEEDDDERFVPDARGSLDFFVTVLERVRVVAEERDDDEEFLFTVAFLLVERAVDGRVATRPLSEERDVRFVVLIVDERG